MVHKLLWAGILLLLGVIACLSGCMVGPDYTRPDTVVNDVDRFAWLPADWDDVNQTERLGPWWKEFNDPVLDDLVDQALMANTDILVALSTIDQARSLVQQAHGIRLPEVTYGLTRDRMKQSFSFGPLGGRISFISESYSQGFNLSYMLDVFGALKRSHRAAIKDMLANEADCEALMHAIVGQVVGTRIDMVTQSRLLEITNDTISNWEQAAEITQQRYEGGLTSPLDVYFVKQNLADARAQKTVVSQQLALLTHAMNVLCSKSPSSGLDTKILLAEVPPLTSAPVGVPAQLLDRRPDVRAAEVRLAAATERVGVSMAQLYPDLVITATGGVVGDEFYETFDLHNRVYSLGLNLAGPLFNGGRLRAGVKASEAAAEQAAHLFAGKVLRALQEVEDALASEYYVRQRITHYEESTKFAQDAEALASERYLQGAESILTVLEAERAQRVSQIQLVRTQGQLWLARVQLYLAAGGDWAAPEPEPSS
ncbi:MAG: efflux transporter outer membrane subunit [Planctomycetes bacterium]|nr:efflux transporter outer membrane subunit [Planctomycetota bacterium]